MSQPPRPTAYFSSGGDRVSEGQKNPGYIPNRYKEVTGRSEKECPDINAGQSNNEELGLAGPDAVLPASTIITGNIRNLKPGLRDNEIEYIDMIAKNKNAFLISLTEL